MCVSHVNLVTSDSGNFRCKFSISCSIHVFSSENVQMLSILLNLCINAQVHKHNVCKHLNFRFRRCVVQSTLGMAPLNLCFNILFYVFLLSLFTRITSALFIYDRRTLLDIGHHCTNLLQDTLSTDPAWPLEILRSTEADKGRLNNPRRRRKHRGRRAGIRNRLRKRAHSPPLPSILLANVQSLENKMDDLRARISFQRDIRDCNILCLTETWLTPTVPDTAVTPSDNFSVLRMDRTAEAGKTKGGGVCFMINKKWCDPRNISILSRSCSPHLEHLSIICRPFYLPREFTSSLHHHKQILAWLCPYFTTSSAATSTSTLTLPPSSLGTLTKPTSKKSCQTFTNIYPVQPEDRIHWIIATPSLRMPTKLVPCRLLANQTTPPSFSHRKINNGSFRDPRWRGK